jgi:multisubunit Na+/H+ antiporter MnhE subunit
MWRWLEAAVWALVLTLCWCATATTISAAELVLAAAGGLLGGISAVLAREAYGGRWRARARWLAWLRALPGALLTDSVHVVLAAVRGQPGELRTLPLPGADSPEHTTRAAMAGLLLSATPGGYLVDAPPEREGLLLHVVGPETALERAVRR